jgi:hypothetical protein
VSALTFDRPHGGSIASSGTHCADRGARDRAGISAALRSCIFNKEHAMDTIDDKALSAVSGGNRVTLIEDLVSRIGKLDLTKKQIGKLDKQVSKFEDKAATKGVVPRVADGDFGAPASSFIPITGD